MGEGEGWRRGRGAVARGVVERCVVAKSACCLLEQSHAHKARDVDGCQRVSLRRHGGTARLGWRVGGVCSSAASVGRACRGCGRPLRVTGMCCGARRGRAGGAGSGWADREQDEAVAEVRAQRRLPFRLGRDDQRLFDRALRLLRADHVPVRVRVRVGARVRVRVRMRI